MLNLPPPMRVRQHVNPLGPGFEQFRGRRPRLEAGRPVEIEVGCADAQFLFERAAADPDRHYLGFEIREQLVEAVAARAAALGAPVQAVFCNANLHLADLLPPGSVCRAYLNFPDPWFKRRHHERRMIDDRLLAALAVVMKPGGELFVQSDVWEVALDALAVCERHERAFVNLAGPWSFWKEGNPYGARSWREQHCEEEGMPIWRVRYRRG
jgi:tRNA (guanine-N7-)-methyltransferase